MITANVLCDLAIILRSLETEGTTQASRWICTSSLCVARSHWVCMPPYPALQGMALRRLGYHAPALSVALDRDGASEAELRLDMLNGVQAFSLITPSADRWGDSFAASAPASKEVDDLRDLDLGAAAVDSLLSRYGIWPEAVMLLHIFPRAAPLSLPQSGKRP